MASESNRYDREVARHGEDEKSTSGCHWVYAVSRLGCQNGNHSSYHHFTRKRGSPCSESGAKFSSLRCSCSPSLAHARHLANRALPRLGQMAALRPSAALSPLPLGQYTAP